MVQIIDNSPDAATLRQRALSSPINQLANGIDEISAAYQQGQATQRQRALDNLKTANELSVTTGEVENYLKPPQTEGIVSRIGRMFTGEEAPVYERPDILANARNIKEEERKFKRDQLDRETQDRIDDRDFKQKQFKYGQSKDAQAAELEKQKFLRDSELKQRELAIKEKEASNGKAPNDVQLKMAGFAARAKMAHDELKQLPRDVGTSAISSTIQGSSFFPEALKSEEMKKFEQVKRNFVSAVLRPESGAAISDQEQASEEKKYFPQPGDTPAVIAQKESAREQAISNLNGQAGNATSRIAKVPQFNMQQGQSTSGSMIAPASAIDHSEVMKQVKAAGLSREEKIKKLRGQ